MKRAVYSMEIKVERNKTTGETRVLSSHTKLPVDCSHGGVKVYEDEQKGDVLHVVRRADASQRREEAQVSSWRAHSSNTAHSHLCPLVVHEVDGQDGVRLLSAAEVEELILKAEQAADKVAEQEAVWEAEQVAMRKAEQAADKAAVQAAEQAKRVTNKAAEQATHQAAEWAIHQAAIALLAKSRQSQGITMVSVEAERIPIRQGNTSPSGGGAEPEAAVPPPTKHESLGEKKACMCCSAM
ncbi:paralemmin 1a isoform X2 [Syngnathus acus]|uniref:paralemmin 1a isoform X2 n=1 Tax=Syngnathus acus TaxID=161584 RepID=UPI001885AEB9|nr:paralemmin 1a isoform X2 [Syngnathus acus]